MGTDPGALLLQNKDVNAVLDVPECIDALELMFSDWAAGQADSMPRFRFYTPLEAMASGGREGDSAPPSHWFNLHAGVVPRSGFGALRVDSGKAEFLEQFGTRRLEFPDQLVGLVLLFRLSTGALEAIISDHYINPVRVAGTTAVGVRQLAQQPIRTFGLYGTGWQARWHLSACRAVLPDLERVVIYSPNEEHRTRFVRTQRERFPDLDIVAADRPGQAAEGLDLVIAATNAVTPVLHGRWLKPGAHVACIAGGDLWDKGTEIDADVAARASIVAVNRIAAVREQDQRALMEPVNQGKLDYDDIQDLGTIINRGAKRSSAGDITLHYNNEGLGIQFAAVGGVLYDRAMEVGVGTRLPYTWRGRDA